MTRTVLAVLCVGLLSLSGCRLYGGYETTETITEQIPETIQRFGDELARAEGDLNQLKQAARAELVPLIATFEAVVDEHRMILSEHEHMHEDLLENPSMKDFVVVQVGEYRKAHRTLGAMLGDQDMIRAKYQDVLYDMEVALLGEDAAPKKISWDEYQQTPVFYEQIRWRLEQPTVQGLLSASPAAVNAMQVPAAPLVEN
ncbi:MAG: hypothetical protein RhofKO_06680 [Rhodothermales bacterium]